MLSGPIEDSVMCYTLVIGLLVFFQPTPNSSAAFPSALWCRWINFKLCHWRGAPLCSSVSVPTHPVCNIKCKSSLHWYPLSIQTNTKYKSLRLNMQGSSYRSEPSYYTFGNRRWPVFVRCYRERVKRAQVSTVCVLDNTNVRLSPPGPRSTIAATPWPMNGGQQQGRFCCWIWPQTSKMGKMQHPCVTRCKKRPWFAVFMMTTIFKLGACVLCTNPN